MGMVSEAFSDEIFTLISNLRFLGKDNFSRVENGLIPHNSHLRLVMAKRFNAKHQFVKNDSNWPDINLARYLRILKIKTFGRLIPVCADPLACKLNFILALIDGLAESKVSYFNFSIVENDILRFKVIVDDSLLLVVKVLDSWQYLWYN